MYSYFILFLDHSKIQNICDTYNTGNMATLATGLIVTSINEMTEHSEPKQNIAGGPGKVPWQDTFDRC